MGLEQRQRSMLGGKGLGSSRGKGLVYLTYEYLLSVRHGSRSCRSKGCGHGGKQTRAALVIMRMYASSGREGPRRRTLGEWKNLHPLMTQ